MIHEFFDCLSNFFRGRGFHTSAQKAWIPPKLVEKNSPFRSEKLTEDESSKSEDVTGKEVAQLFKEDEAISKLKSNDKIKNHIKNLSSQEIEDYVKSDYFNLKKTMTATISDWKELTDLWSDEQKRTFYSAILDREDGMDLLAKLYQKAHHLHQQVSPYKGYWFN